mmetsp:Transcript_29573/g.66928  ORF Transcript_29573/g.66928 Transcript_29573/m.66928 type:complete len:320 (+) Transcript_29573:73-1032(+)
MLSPTSLPSRAPRAALAPTSPTALRSSRRRRRTARHATPARRHRKRRWGRRAPTRRPHAAAALGTSSMTTSLSCSTRMTLIASPRYLSSRQIASGSASAGRTFQPRGRRARASRSCPRTRRRTGARRRASGGSSGATSCRPSCAARNRTIARSSIQTRTGSSPSAKTHASRDSRIGTSSLDASTRGTDRWGTPSRRCWRRVSESRSSSLTQAVTPVGRGRRHRRQRPCRVKVAIGLSGRRQGHVSNGTRTNDIQCSMGAADRGADCACTMQRGRKRGKRMCAVCAHVHVPSWADSMESDMPRIVCVQYLKSQYRTVCLH